MARAFYQAIMSSSAPVINLKDTYRFERYLHKIYLRFREHLPLKGRHCLTITLSTC